VSNVYLEGISISFFSFDSLMFYLPFIIIIYLHLQCFIILIAALTAQADEAIDKFHEWFQKIGAKAPKLKIHEFENMGKGIKISACISPLHYTI
jgi:hypothetical protein